MDARRFEEQDEKNGQMGPDEKAMGDSFFLEFMRCVDHH